jgi:hypothetical protein
MTLLFGRRRKSEESSSMCECICVTKGWKLTEGNLTWSGGVSTLPNFLTFSRKIQTFFNRWVKTTLWTFLKLFENNDNILVTFTHEVINLVLVSFYLMTKTTLHVRIATKNPYGRNFCFSVKKSSGFEYWLENNNF